MPTKIIMVGNPGSGKSTLLSSLVEQPLFPSGISIGRGKTRELKVEEHKGYTYIDTPGLSDVKLREKAASEIERAFKMGGTFQVFFVMTLESGRVRPDDIATMKLVLDALPQMRRNGYSIIVNKIPPHIISALTESNQEREELEAYLAPPLIEHGTHSIFYVPLNPNLIDQTNKLSKLEFLSFISSAPQSIISSNQVHAIQYGSFEAICDSMHQVTQELRDDNAALQRAIAEQDKRFCSIHHPPLKPELKQHSIIFINNSTEFAAWEHSVLMHIVESIGYERTKFTNTDGLSDSKIRNNAAKSIESTFQKGGSFKVFFIVQFSSSRIKPTHLATIQLVLQAVPQIKDQYSVIVIPSKKSYDTVHHARDFFPNSIQFKPHAQHFCVPGDNNWTEQSSKLREGLRGFIERTPETTITADQVQTIKHEHFSNTLSSFSTKKDKLAFWRK